MDTQATLGSLNLFTLIAVLVVVIGASLWYFRKRENRQPMDPEQGMSDTIHKASAAEDRPRAKDAR